MRLRALAVVALLVTLAAVATPGGPAALASAGSLPAASSTSSVTGNVSGPGLVATESNATFYFNATGGPAVQSGSFIGTINWTASLTGANTTGSSVSPTSGNITNNTTQPIALNVTTGAIVESLTLTIELTSKYGSANATTNITKTFRLVLPYAVRATLVAGPNAAVLPFNVTVALDGTLVGVVTVPEIQPNATYAFQYRYASGGLSSGYHTFTLTIEDSHGLVTFSNGRTVLTTTFYVAPPAANDTVWVVIGIVAFFAVLFIYATRVAARRRAPTRR